MRYFYLSIVLLLFISSIFPTKVQAQQATNINLLQNLLDWPAPPPNPLRTAELANRSERSEEFYDIKKKPADDAPIEDLLDYWARQNGVVEQASFHRESRLRPSETAMRRILEAVQEKPESLPKYLSLLPDTPDSVALVKQRYDEEMQSEKNSPDKSRLLKEWLKFHSSYYTDELYAKVRKVKDRNGDTANEKELFALAKVDWERAQPFLQQLENDRSQQITAISAMWAIYQHALDTKDDSEAEKYRDKLKAIVEDRTADVYARDKAMDALIRSDAWAGRDDWYLSLLSDETLYLLEGENGVYTGLTTMVIYEDAEKWIPIMTRLVASKDPNVHNAAVRNLMQMKAVASRELLEPLLPWLSNPTWAKEPQRERLEFILMLKEVDLPESVPGLINVVINEREEYRSSAAQALAKYKDSRAIPALRLALSEETREYLRQPFIAALVASGGFTDDEQAAGLEIFAIEATKRQQQLAERNPDNFDAPVTVDYSKSMPTSYSIGDYLSQQTEVSDGVITKLFDRLKTLQTSNPAAAKLLYAIMQKWESRVMDLALLEQISSNKADADVIVNLLARRQELRIRVLGELFSMRGKGGTARGMSAVITEDKSEMFSILGGNDAEAAIAMLGCARLVRALLPVSEVAALLKDKNKLLALAAERYLESEDSPQAQALVLAQHPNENLILGAKGSFNPRKNAFQGRSESLVKLFLSVNNSYPFWQTFENIDKFEGKLLREIKESNDLLEVYAFLPNSEGGQVMIRVFKNRAVFTVYEDTSRYRERSLNDEELKGFRGLLAESNIEAMPPLYDICSEGCSEREFVTLNQRRGRRVFIRARGDVPEPLGKLQVMLDEFAKSQKMKLHYYLEDKIKGLEILLADDTNKAQAVWKRGDDLRVLVADSAKYEANKRETEREADLAAGADDAGEERVNETQQKNRAKQEFAHFSWRDLQSDGKLGAALPQPIETRFLPDDEEVSKDNIADNRRGWQVRAGDYEIHVGYVANDGEPALMKMSPSQTPVVLIKGNYSSPLVTPDGKWVIASKTEQTPKPPYRTESVWRINVLTGKEFKVNLPPAYNIKVAAFAPAHNKILIGRSKNYNGNSVEYFLLDAETGLAEPVQGNFQPLLQQTYRPLQPTSKGNVYWAAIANKKAENTQFGLYDTQSFAFKPLINLPDIQFDSMNCWVDETAGKIYFVYEGHLLVMPIPKETTR